MKITQYILVVLFSSFIFPNSLFALDKYEAQVKRERDVSSVYSVYIPMRDGVRIAADIHLPTSLKPGEKIPALLYQTIYLRSHRVALSEKPNISNPEDWRVAPRLESRKQRPVEFDALKKGYAIIKIDVRGTGASFGHRNSVLPLEEIQDNTDIIDWIIAQEWSSGSVGAYGVSYTGMTAGLAPIVKHPALKAVVLGWSGIYDEYKTAMQPYGLVQPGVLCVWSDLLANLWGNNWQVIGKSPMPVDGDEDGVLLSQAIDEHKKNETVCNLASPIVYSDDVIGKNKISIQSFSQRESKKEIEDSGVAIFTLASWYDTGAVDAHFVRLKDFSNNQKIFLTGGQHGGLYHASPYLVDNEPAPPIPSGDVTWGKALQFFDYHLKGKDNGYDTWPVVTYWNLGEEAFRTSGAWPIKDTKYQRFYMAAEQQLSVDKPQSEIAYDNYKINFNVTTGTNSRWWTGIGKPMLGLADRRDADKKLLTYTSEPLKNDLQITGWPVVSLNVISTHKDGAFIAYLEDVDPSGKSTYINEGGLRALHRKVKDNPVTGLPSPYHSFKRADAAYMTPGEPTEIKFEMIPTSVRIAKGHRIRIAIAGADKDNFMRTPANGDPVITVNRSRDQASYIDLPTVE